MDLALVRLDPAEIVFTFPASARSLTLPGGEPNTVISPPQAGWEGFGFRIAQVIPADPPPEGKVAVARTVELIDGVPAELLTLEDAPPEPRRMVAKSLVTQRVIDAGKIDQAMAMLQMDWAKFARWVAPDQPAVYFDDPDAIAMIEALELDPEVIMAPE